ncbi:hypothetical protein GO730_24205 [Spirosoma sp. HMF3257]|uniref:ParE-like toxin domain-containing protein n=1 Tax=Spirosoma telluris TaxID=2183553 RepID=A0A327NMQ3_9BACT|nr:hypothetical protein [Spirosoma telluris]RAI76482.1 hypothetical protein HMF3257_24145 [Spirosoma telluris]
MRHFTSDDFWDRYNDLAVSIQKLADKNYELLKQNPKHPSLYFKQVNQYWSVRVGRQYRAVGIETEEGIIWFWIGTHTEYDKLIG